MPFEIKYTKIDDKKHIFYNYYDTFSKNISEPGNIKCSFPGNPNSPNVVFLNGQTQTTYISSNLYIFSKTHDIAGIRFDAELMIEHTPITNGGKTLIFSFPLRTDPRPELTPIDTLVHSQFGKSLDIDLNNYLHDEDNHCIFYETDTYYVCVSSIPILVHSSFPSLNLSTHPKLHNTDTYTMIRAVQNNAYKELDKSSAVKSSASASAVKSSASVVKSSVVEGMDVINPVPTTCSDAPYQPYYLQCSNVPLDDATDVANIILPANSTVPLDVGASLTSSGKTSEASYRVMTNSIIYFFGFICIMLISYSIVPILYRQILEGVCKQDSDNSGQLDLVLFVVSFVVITILLAVGINMDIVYVTYAGLILLIFSIISVFTIQIVVKMDKSYKYDKTYNFLDPKLLFNPKLLLSHCTG